MRNVLQLFLLFFIASTALIAQEIEHPHSIQHSFIENKGQWDENVLFQSRFHGGNLWIQQNKFVFHLQDFSAMYEAHMGHTKDVNPIVKQTVVHLNFPGSNQVENIQKTHPTKSYYNYFLGNKSEKWTSDVRGYSEASLPDFYNGIDLKLIENKEELKYEFHVKPQVDPAQIQLEYVGQKELYLDERGNLVVSTELGNIIEHKPYSYQIINGKIVEVKCSFQLEDNKVVFRLGNYNSELELVIDPVLVFATYSGSPTDNFGMTATYAHNGDAYSGGTIFGNQYPTPDNGAYDVNSNFTVPNNGNGAGYGITDVFISKYSADGSTMIWTSFLGGGDNTQGTETVHSLIADTADNLYLYGATSSTDFPIQNGYQSTHGGGTTGMNFLQNGVYHLNQGTDIYVSKLSSNGHNLLGSTYVGGSGNDGINYNINYFNTFQYDSLMYNYGDNSRGEIMLDGTGNCIIASCTRSQDFPVVNPFQSVNGGMQDGVIFKLSSNLSTLQWSSYFGGSNNDACYSVKIDSSNNIVFAGGTCSTNLSNTGGSWQSTYNGGKADGFVAKLTPNGLGMSVVSYIGTTNYDQAYFVEIDRNDNVFLLGQSRGGQFPVFNAPFASTFNNLNSSQFICKLNPSLTALLNSTTFGNGGAIPNISPAAFLVDVCGNLYMTGWGGSVLNNANPLSNMAVSNNAFSATPPNGYDFYLMVVDRTFSNLVYGTYLGGNVAKEHVDGGTSRFDKNGVVYQSVCGGCAVCLNPDPPAAPVPGCGPNSDFPTTPGVHSNTNDSPNCNNIVFKFSFDLMPKAEFDIGDSAMCAAFPVIFQNTSTVTDTYLWDFGNGDTTSVIFNPSHVYDTPGTYTVHLYVTDSICQLTDTATITITITDSVQLDAGSDINVCIPVPLDLIANSFGTGTSFVWSDNINFTDTLNSNISDSTLSVTPTNDITYYVMVENQWGCSKIDSVQVHFTSSDLVLSANDSICAGDTSLITAQNLNPSIVFTYDWQPSSVIVTPSTSNTVLVNPPATQYVYVTATANNGCIIEDSIQIFVSNINATSVIATASGIYIPEGDTVTLIGLPNGYSYQWLPFTGIENPTAQQTSAVVDHTTTYTLLVSDGICTKSDTVLVQAFTFVCENPFVFVPNAFSPNGDNENDVLYVRGPMIKEMLFRVYNRWGELMFESTDRSHGWDGTFRGKKMDPDVYDYYLKVTCIDDVESIIKGNITLLK